MQTQTTHPAPAETSKTATATMPANAVAALTAALNSPRAINASPQQLEYVLAQAMAKAFADMGINTADRRDEITYLVQNMPAEVTRHLPNIRLNEIGIAIGKGVLQQFGQFYGLNVATFMRFLMEHYQSMQRAEAVKQYQLANLPVTPNLTAGELKKQRHERIIAAFGKYKKQGFYHDYGNLVFNHINTMGKVPISPEREAAILQQARHNLIIRNSRGSLYANERERLKSNLQKILNGQGATLILTEAKQLALNELFNYLINDGMEMEEFLS